MDAALRRVLRKVDRSGHPAYAQIEDRLTEVITSGGLAPGDRLPPERELAERFGVSRMTLRQALEPLARRGLLVRAVGRKGGTFVAEPKAELDLTAVAGLTQQLRRQGDPAGARIVSATEGPCGRRTAEALGLEIGDPVFEVVRVRLSDEEPLALEHSVFPAALLPGLLDLPLDGSLYELLEDRYGRAPRSSVERLESVPADARVAEALQVPPGTPLMVVERTAFTSDGVAIEYARDRFRGDRTRILVQSGEPT
jgi:GntR family transcriptional regulator